MGAVFGAIALGAAFGPLTAGADLEHRVGPEQVRELDPGPAVHRVDVGRVEPPDAQLVEEVLLVAHGSHGRILPWSGVPAPPASAAGPAARDDDADHEGRDPQPDRHVHDRGGRPEDPLHSLPQPHHPARRPPRTDHGALTRILAQDFVVSGYPRATTGRSAGSLRHTAPMDRQSEYVLRTVEERGVRFVQIYHGAGSKWDAHAKIETNHAGLCASMDKPVAGLLKDLKSRGLLEDTLVVWGGEFGRTPMSEKGDGRDHNPTGFTMWMAGGGVKGGQVIGATDEFGLHAVEDRLHVHDLHATILHLLGINHENLVFSYKGRPERATMNEGEIYRKITG